MVIVIGLMVCGIILGQIFKNKNLFFIPKLLNYAIYLLLLLLGISIGANDHVMNHLDTIGWDALLITLVATMGSVLCAWGIYRLYFMHTK